MKYLICLENLYWSNPQWVLLYQEALKFDSLSEARGVILAHGFSSRTRVITEKEAADKQIVCEVMNV